MLTADILIEERDRLEKEIADLDSKRRRLGLINDLLKTYSSEEKTAHLALGEALSNKLQEGYKISKNPDAFGITDRVVEYLKTNSDFSFTPREIGREILLQGFSTNSPHLFTTISAICARKVKRGQFTESIKGGFKAYRYNI